ncbi:hypothetical protein D3C71_1988030 [compost metagenome]
MRAIGQDLFGHFAPQDAQRRDAPGIGLRSHKELTGEQQRFGIGKQVIAQQMDLQAFGQPAHLYRQAVELPCIERIARQRPFDPVDDA